MIHVILFGSVLLNAILISFIMANLPELKHKIHPNVLSEIYRIKHGANAKRKI